MLMLHKGIYFFEVLTVPCLSASGVGGVRINPAPISSFELSDSITYAENRSGRHSVMTASDKISDSGPNKFDFASLEPRFANLIRSRKQLSPVLVSLRQKLTAGWNHVLSIVRVKWPLEYYRPWGPRD